MKWIDDAVSHLEALEALGLDARQDKAQLRDMLAKDMKKLILAVRLAENRVEGFAHTTDCLGFALSAHAAGDKPPTSEEMFKWAELVRKADARANKLAARLRSGEVEGNPPHKDKPAPREDAGEKPRCCYWSDGRCGESPRWACSGTAAPPSAKSDCYEPAPSEDEGEVGRRLFAIRTGYEHRRMWLKLSANERARYTEQAIRFRDECLAEVKELAEAAARYKSAAIEYYASPTIPNSTAITHATTRLKAAARGLPDLGEAPEDKSPPSST